ncbi:MAG TPA: M23 family metallopeptidase [Longimicrobium sp.]|nr:M23 family metallopeptidase [Longimicrobium sp.]
MRSSRFILPFVLGAACMLGAVTAIEWAVPGELGRAHSALRPGDAIPALAPIPDAAPPALPVLVTTPATEGPAPAVIVPVDVPAPAAPRGGLGLLIPVQGVKGANLVDTYEQSRGQGRRHDAIDIMAARGTPVLAVADGTVMKLFQSERGGITLYELAPDRRTIYYYAHLDRYAPGIAEGQTLRRGQLLGYVGNTGDAGPGNYHLHFEVSTTSDPRKYWGGAPQNPYPLLQ